MPSVILTPAQVAERLNISENMVIQLMLELPHINVSRDLYSKHRRIRITEKAFEVFANGIIMRRRLRRGG